MAWPYGWFAERYGWTPQEVNAMPLWIMLQFPVYAAAADEAKAYLQEVAAAQAKAEAAVRRR